MATGRIAVLGAGAIGMLFAALLSRVSTQPVTLVTRRATAQLALRDGVEVTKADGERLVCTHVHALLENELPEVRHDVVLVAVSAYDTRAAAITAQRLLAPDSICITLQNGLDNRDQLAEVLGQTRVIQGATSFAVHTPDARSVVVASAGASWLPALPAGFAWFEDRLREAGLNPIRIADARELAWHKTAISVNGYLCMILRKPLGQVVRCAPACEIARLGCMEIIDVAASQGVFLDKAAMVSALEKSWAACKLESTSSMYNDITSGKRTELEERLGSVLRYAQSAQIAAPNLNALYHLAQASLQLWPVSAAPAR